MAGELVERLRDQNYAGPLQHLRSWSEIDELFNAAAQRIEDVEADYLRRHNDACDRFEQVIELEARIEALERENATLRAALEPFASLGAEWVDDEGWNELACKNDRICDWIGPSDFRRAASIIAGTDLASVASVQVGDGPQIGSISTARKQAFEEAAQIAENYLPSTFDAKAIAAAIRNMGGGENG